MLYPECDIKQHQYALGEIFDQFINEEEKTEEYGKMIKTKLNFA